MLGTLARYGLLAAFALLAGAGVGVPVPEEATQLAAGALAQRGSFPLAAAIAICWSGILAGDLAWFALARRLGPKVLGRRPLRKVLGPERRAKLEAHLRRRGFLTVAVARHLSGLRLPIFALAATHGVRGWTFALADGVSALISVPLVVGVGFFGARHLAQAEAHVRRIELVALAAAAVAALAFLLIRLLQRARSRAEPAPGEAHD